MMHAGLQDTLSTLVAVTIFKFLEQNKIMKNLYLNIVPSKIPKIAIWLLCGLSIAIFLSLTSVVDTELVRAQSPRTNAAVYHFQLGQWRAMSISDGTLSFPPSNLVPNAPSAEVAEALTSDFLPPEELSLYINVLYLDNGDRQILIDTGSGTGQGAGQLIANLNSGGVTAEDIDTVIITHAHPDHIGGITKAEKLNFPNAQYYLSENEWNFWTADSVKMPDSLLDEQTKQQMVATAKPILQQIGDRVTRFRSGEEIIPGIQAIDVSGHTPGQSAYAITSNEDRLIVTGDIFYSDPLNLEHPEWQVGFDVDPVQGVATRRQMLEQLESDRTLLLVPHMSFPGLGYVKAEGENYQWQPISWQFNPS